MWPRNHQVMRKNATCFFLLMLSCSSCTAIQLANDAQYVVAPVYGSHSPLGTLSWPAQVIDRAYTMGTLGKPRAMLTGPEGKRVDVFALTEESESEGITFREKAAYVVFYRSDGMVQGLLRAESKDEYNQIAAFTECARQREGNKPSAAYEECLPRFWGEFSRLLRREGEEAFKNAKYCAAPRAFVSVDWSKEGPRCFSLFERALGCFELADGEKSPGVMKVLDGYAELLGKSGRYERAREIKLRLGNPGT